MYIIHALLLNLLLLFADENLQSKAKGLAHLSELQKAKIVDFISQNNFGDACFDPEKSELTKLSAWEKVWTYATTECEILKNKNPCENVSKLRETLRKWRYEINKKEAKRSQTGQGAVPPLSDVDQRYKILLDGVEGIATGKKVHWFFTSFLSTSLPLYFLSLD